MKKAAMVFGSVVIGGTLLTSYTGLEKLDLNASASESIKYPNPEGVINYLVDDQGREYGYDMNGNVIFPDHEKTEETKDDDSVFISSMNMDDDTINAERSSHVSTLSDEIHRNDQEAYDKIRGDLFKIQESNVITKENAEYDRFIDVMEDIYPLIDPWKNPSGYDESVIGPEEENEYYDAAIKYIAYAKYFEDEIKENGWYDEVKKAMSYNVAIVNQDHNTTYGSRLDFGTGVIDVIALHDMGK
ncbi:hypothetical protein [Sporosarcina trichiuri]|uniref:hypothetical protein n=1 Tax=Sporosarcina trichiuri TaxID=3056445 RepID=UPI0025B34CD4|nr:hypothetical protein [Sporosarcina sp. 0.2-SM1T-5]WJY27542.1 hypothetical protein QWT68_00530 [Sporosarcina sp. 0.2-SM1T-5]